VTERVGLARPEVPEQSGASAGGVAAVRQRVDVLRRRLTSLARSAEDEQRHLVQLLERAISLTQGRQEDTRERIASLAADLDAIDAACKEMAAALSEVSRW
jgi:chromosome segregation ATPase